MTAAEDPDVLWDQVKARVRPRLSAGNQRLMLDEEWGIEIRGGRFAVGVAWPWQAEMVARALPLIHLALRDLGHPLTPVVVVWQDHPDRPPD